MSKEEKKGAGRGRKKRATSQNTDHQEDQEQGNSKSVPPKQAKAKQQKQVKSPPKQNLSQNLDFVQATPPSPKQVQAKNKDSKKMIRKPQQEPDKKKAPVKQPQIKETPEALLDYFMKQNRPFSVNWLKDTLCLKAATLIKNIDLLVSKGDLTMKEVGASKVYLINQQLMPQVNQQEMNDLTEKMKQLDIVYTEIKTQVMEYQNKIKLICRIPRLQDLVKQEEELIDREQKLENKKSDLSSQGGRVDIKIVEQVENNHAEIEGKAKKYKRIYKDAIGEILQESELTIDQFEAMIGIQRD